MPINADWHKQHPMPKSPSLRALLAGKWEDGTRPKDLFALHVEKEPQAHVEEILAGLGDAERRVQNGCAELASLLAECAPELLYPHLDRFTGNLEAEEAVLRWEAVCTVGSLAASVTLDGLEVPPSAAARWSGVLADRRPAGVPWTDRQVADGSFDPGTPVVQREPDAEPSDVDSPRA